MAEFVRGLAKESMRIGGRQFSACLLPMLASWPDGTWLWTRNFNVPCRRTRVSANHLIVVPPWFAGIEIDSHVLA